MFDSLIMLAMFNYIDVIPMCIGYNFWRKLARLTPPCIKLP